MLSSPVHPVGPGTRRARPVMVTLPALLALLTSLVVTSLVLLGPGGGGSGGGAAAADPSGPAQWEPPAHTIVGVSGSALDGFTISRYDGSELSPPTDSEARAECGEYDRRVARVRCRVEVATWYRDLGDLQLSLRWARQQ